jgi:hypothetical protein
MRRVSAHIYKNPAPTHNRFRRRFWFLILILALSPFIADVVNLYGSKWYAMMGYGDPYEVATPTLDALSEFTRSASRSLWATVNPLFHDPAWKPGPTIAIALAWAFLASFLLRGGGRRP